MFSLYKYLVVSLVFSHLGFWSRNLFLIAPFPDLCLLVPFKHVPLGLRRVIVTLHAIGPKCGQLYRGKFKTICHICGSINRLLSHYSIIVY